MATSLAHAESWSGENVRIADVERALAELRCRDPDGHGATDLRTSVLTHIAWVPPEWREAAEAVLEGLAERHPSRTIMLLPEPDSSRNAIDAEVTIEAFDLPELERHVATEVVRLRLSDGRVRVPASIVLPLLIPDLPVFLRWRGEPRFRDAPFEQLTGVADRLVVDSREWRNPLGTFGSLAELFGRVAVSDIAWARTTRWREALARLWPGIGDAHRLRVEGPQAEALLLAGWLRSRLQRQFDLEHHTAPELAAVAVDGEPVAAAAEEAKSPSDLLSDQLEIFGRDRIYEQAALAAAT